MASDKKVLCKHLAFEFGTSVVEAARIVSFIEDFILQSLQDKGSFTLKEIMTIKKVGMKERKLYNPVTGKIQDIPKRNILRLVPHSRTREMLEKDKINE